jgi:mercuric ion transport protein
MKVELIYEQTCPNIEAARTRLVQAFHSARIPAKWCEWEVGQPETPEYARRYGSPTILVDGNDVSGRDSQASSNSCRLYETDAGYEPVPTVKQIAGVLGQAASDGTVARKSRSVSIAALPSLGVVLLPKLTCPICWPAYTALLSSAGISFVNYTPYLLPTVAILLAITLCALAYRAPARRGYGPFWLGLLGSFSVLTGKFTIENDLVLYLGVALLVGASLWNIWPHRLRKRTTPISA